MPDDLEEAREVKAELRRALERVEALRKRLLEKPVEREGPTTRLGGADADSEDRRRELVFGEVDEIKVMVDAELKLAMTRRLQRSTPEFRLEALCAHYEEQVTKALDSAIRLHSKFDREGVRELSGRGQSAVARSRDRTEDKVLEVAGKIAGERLRAEVADGRGASHEGLERATVERDLLRLNRGVLRFFELALGCPEDDEPRLRSAPLDPGSAALSSGNAEGPTLAARQLPRPPPGSPHGSRRCSPNPCNRCGAPLRHVLRGRVRGEGV